MLRTTVVVGNRLGLHLRAAGAVAKLAKSFAARLDLVNQSVRADCRNVLEMLSLVAETGTVLELQAEGADAGEALAAVERLFLENFGEEAAERPEQTDPPSAGA